MKRPELKLDSEEGDFVEVVIPVNLDWAAYLADRADDDDLLILGQLVVDGLCLAFESYRESSTRLDDLFDADVASENSVKNSLGQSVRIKVPLVLDADIEGWKRDMYERGYWGY